jgi:hypothetical protein
LKGFHIPLAQRKLICGRLVFFQAAYPGRLSLLTAGAESEFDQVRDNIFRLTERAPYSSPDSEPLDYFLGRLLGDLEDQMRPNLRGQHGALFRLIQDDIRGTVERISCLGCTPVRPRICDGGNKDDEIVGNGGACIAPIRAMFDDAVQVTTGSYVKYCNLFGPKGAPDLSFSTSFCNSKPHDIPGDYFVGAVTTHNDSSAQVDLCLWPNRFDWNTYAAITYVLFHECICHAYQGMRPVRPKPLNDGFVEGWMDWIAFECFRKHLESTPAKPSVQDSLDAGTAFHLLRSDYNHKEKSDRASICALGRSGAQSFEHLLKRLPESASDPWSSLLMVSFDLNLVGGLSDRELYALYMRLTPERQLDSPKLEELVQPLRKYLNSRKIEYLLDDIIRLTNE